MDKVKIGVIGCGCISDIYLTNLTGSFSHIIEVAAVCDIIPERALSAKEKYGIADAYFTDEEILARKDIEVIVCLTEPRQHFPVIQMALNAGKNVHTEKPLSIERVQGEILLKTAQEKGLYLGVAPDTFLGSGIQTCRKLIDDGVIGRPVAAAAFMTCHGHESWHPDPEFYYEVGGGPMLDMGPYYITALVNLLGAVKSVSGTANTSFPKRVITSAKKYGKEIPVETATHIAGTINFESGAVGTLITSFDIWGANLPNIEIYGTEGSIAVPDPNTFGGPVKIKTAESGFMEYPLTHAYQENSRGLGVADMAYAIRNKRKNRACGELGYHVLEVMTGFFKASETGKNYEVLSTVERPAPFEAGLYNKRISK